MNHKSTPAVEYYFWTGQEVVHIDQWIEPRDRALRFHDMPCLCIEPGLKPSYYRYNFMGWHRLVKAKRPKQLRAIELLLT